MLATKIAGRNAYRSCSGGLRQLTRFKAVLSARRGELNGGAESSFIEAVKVNDLYGGHYEENDAFADH
jgi:hypothetical protein